MDNQTKYVASLSRRGSRSRYKHMQKKTETLRVVYLRSVTLVAINDFGPSELVLSGLF